MLDRFSWRSYDLSTVLPARWQDSIMELANRRASNRVLMPTHSTSREARDVERLPVSSVSGEALRDELPWLYELYKGLFRDLAQLGSLEPVVTAIDDSYGAVLNIQRGPHMRYECHVDSNPIEGLLYVTTHPPGSGGELVVANSPAARSVDDVDQDASVVYPVAGNLIFFDARRFAHYVRPLRGADDVRIVVAMNFYTPSSSEGDRPQGLSDHLHGSPDD